MEKTAKMRGNIHPLPPARPTTLRDVRDLDGYVCEALREIGVRPSSGAHAALLEQGLDSAYRLERALPPETSLRAVLDQVLRERLISSLRHAGTPALPRPAVASAARAYS
jgi:hypothetical protein